MKYENVQRERCIVSKKNEQVFYTFWFMNYFEDISMDISCYIFIGKYLTKIDVIVKFLSSPDANPEIY